MKFIPRKDYMIEQLHSMLEPEEILEASFVGMILRIGKEQVNWNSYIGITGNTLLVSRMKTLDVSSFHGGFRASLNDIKSVKTRAAIIGSAIIINIKFEDGDSIRIKAFYSDINDISEQEKNIDRFIEKIVQLQLH